MEQMVEVARCSSANEDGKKTVISNSLGSVRANLDNIKLSDDVRRGCGFSDFDDSKCSRIRFEKDFCFEKADILKAIERRASIPSLSPMTVYHRHVWYNYACVLGLGGQQQAGDENDWSFFTFHLLSFGPAMMSAGKLPKGALREEIPENQKEPRIYNAIVVAGIFTEPGEWSPTRAGDLKRCEDDPKHYTAANLVSVAEVQTLLSSYSSIVLRVALSVDKSYFDLQKLIAIEPSDRSASRAVATDETPQRNVKTLAAVLSGQKVHQADVIFTNRNGDIRKFFVHKEVLVAASRVLAATLEFGDTALPTDQIAFVSNERKFVFRNFDADDLKFLLTYIYTDEVLLPEFYAVARVGRVVCALFNSTKVLSVLRRWCAMHISNLLAVEKERDLQTKVTTCLKTLVSVHCAPYGSMTTVKRLAFSLLADELERSESDVLKAAKECEIFHKFACEEFIGSARSLQSLFATARKTSES